MGNLVVWRRTRIL